MFFALVAVNTLPAQVDIDTAISNAVGSMSQQIPAESRVAVINVSTEHEHLSNHIINGLITELVKTRLFRVVPRNEVELGAARAEFRFQLNDTVSRETQTRMGRFLGADTVVTGTVARGVRNTYRLTINAINLEGFYLLDSYSVDVRNDNQLVSLIAGYDVDMQQQADFEVEMARYREERARVRVQRLKQGAANMFWGMGEFLDGNRDLGIGLMTLHSIVFMTMLTVYANIAGPDVDLRPFGIVFGSMYGALALTGWIAPIFTVPGPTRPERPRTASADSAFPF